MTDPSPQAPRFGQMQALVAREAIKNVIEMPDPDADRIIRSLIDSGWSVSGTLRTTYPEIFEPDGRLAAHATRLVCAVRDAFAEQHEASEAADEAAGMAAAPNTPRT